MALRDKEFRSFTDQPVVLEGRRKVREKDHSYQEKLDDLYNFFHQGKSKNFRYYSGSRSLDQRNMKIIAYTENPASEMVFS
jgi:hypothetical protein